MKTVEALDEVPGRSRVYVVAMQTQPATVIERDTQTTNESDPTKCSHIVKTEDGETATAVVLRARIEGLPLTALCGHVFVPSKDPKNMPVCPTCKEIYDLMRMMNEHLNETPNS